MTAKMVLLILRDEMNKKLCNSVIRESNVIRESTVIRKSAFFFSALVISLLTTPLIPSLELPSFEANAQNKAGHSFAINDKVMGVGSCSSSNCHGSVKPRDASNVLQNEYVTWNKKGAHSRAYLVLLEEDSQKIGDHLGIDKPEEHAWCLSCHATYVEKTSLHGDKYSVQDGVGCESCHGPAEKWLTYHAEAGATHQGNLERGLWDLASMDSRTQLCGTCHIGGSDKNVDHRLIGAGHPRLTFETDTFSMLQPAHWKVDDDYIERKKEYRPVQAWLTGQAVLARQNLQRVNYMNTEERKFLPDFTQFYCYTCHHSLKEDQWKTRGYDGRPGEAKYNVAHLLTLKSALAAVEPSLKSKLEAALSDFHSDKAYSEATFKQLDRLLGSEIIPKLRTRNFSKSETKKLLKHIVALSNEMNWPPFEVAEQMAMGVSALVSEMGDSGRPMHKRVEQLYDTLSDPEGYDPKPFVNQLRTFAS